MRRFLVLAAAAATLACSLNARADEALVVYSERREPLFVPILEAWTEQTGIKVQLLTDQAQVLTERILAEGERGRADVMVTVDAGNLWHATQRGALAPIRGKAELLVLLGRQPEARDMLEACISQGRDSLEFGVILCTIEEQAGEYEAVVARAQRYTAGSSAASAANRQLHQVMGRALEKLERYDDAFDAFSRANLGAGPPFNRSGFESSVDHLIKIFSRKNLKLMSRSSIDSEQPIFVTSLPRSGSTLIEQIINAHSHARGVGELNAITAIASSAPARLKTARPYPECLENASRKGLDQLGRAYLDEARKLGGDAQRIADKTLQAWQHLGFLQLTLPEARVIHVRRHPMDTCLSCFMASLNTSAHPYVTTLEDLGFFYRQYDRLVKHWNDVLKIEMMEASYEALVEAPEPTIRAIIEFCGLDWEEDCLQHHKKVDRVVHTLSFDQVRKPLYKTAVARWKRYEKHLAPLKVALGDLAQAD